LFSKATITADLSLTNLNLDDGMGGSTSFTGSSSTTLEFLPSGGSDLVPLNLVTNNADFDTGVLIDAPGTTAVPEPATCSLIVIGIGSMLVQRRRNSKRPPSPSGTALRPNV
jgi:hypothetical protein